MSDELYYRGSSTYEVAVQNQLSRLQNSNVMLRNSIRDMEYGIRSDIRQSTFAIVASQQILAETFQHGFNSVNNTLEIGFNRMSAQMAYISDSIHEMSDKICSKLDEIHDIVNNPLLTQSRELYRRALTNYEKGYYEEALEDIKAAVEKNKTDFISWYLLGQIYLFGAGKFSNVINLDEAENAFFNAAKYIDADIGHSEEAKKLASEIYYYLGYTRLVKSNDLLVENKVDESNKKLMEAENASGRAYQISKENILAGYEYAKELHFLGKDDEALNVLEVMIRAEPTFALKPSNDKNFESMWDKIDALIEKLRDELAHEAIAMVNTIIGTAENKIKSMKSEVNEIAFPEKEEFDNFVKHIDFNKIMKQLDDDVETAKNMLRLTQKGWDTSQLKYDARIEEERRNDILEKEKKRDRLSDLKYKGAVTYMSKEDFSNVCNDCLSSLKSELSKYEQLESENYLLVLKLYNELDDRNSSENLADKFMDKASRKLNLISFLYTELIPKIKEDRESAGKQKETKNKERELLKQTREKENKQKDLIYTISYLLASLTLIPAAITIYNESIGAGFWIFVVSVVFELVASGTKIELREKCSRKSHFAKNTMGIIYNILIAVFSVGMFVIGHKWFGILAVIVVIFDIIVETAYYEGY